MKNILLPTDFSDNSWNAIVYATEFLKKEPCVFYLLHVNAVNPSVISHAHYTDPNLTVEDVYTKPTKKHLTTLLRRIEKISKSDDHKFYALMDYGFFIDVIRRQVEEKQIDLIIMGTKGASGLKKAIIGSNSGDVIVKVQCSTLIVPENARFEEIDEVAFPTDFSSFHDFNTLGPLMEVLERYRSKLSVLHVGKGMDQLNLEQHKNLELLKDLFEGFEPGFFFLSNQKLEQAVQCFTESRGTSMIVMVAKNLNYFQQILFHTRTENISYHTNIPFLVLHESN
jgi:nucleotide-binding universal stress UspA family protein